MCAASDVWDASASKSAMELHVIASLPIGALGVFGILIVVLGLFAAGSVELVVIGLVSIFGAGLLEVASKRRT